MDKHKLETLKRAIKEKKQTKEINNNGYLCGYTEAMNDVIKLIDNLKD